MLSTVSPTTTSLPVPASPYILLVDDHTPSLRRLHDIVKLAGFRCVSAGSASQALRSCEARRPQVVVTDLVMPNMDGCALARWLRTRYPSIPVLLVTGESFDPDAVARWRGTFTAVFSKPIDVGLLLECLDRLMPPSSKSEGGLSRA